MKKLIIIALLIILNSFVFLHSAAAGGNPDANKKLLNTTFARNLEGVIAALAEGADVNTKNEYGTPVLYLSKQYFSREYEKAGDNEIIILLLDNGADINARCLNGSTTLMSASHYGLNNIVNLLLRRGADIELKDDFSETAIDKARESNYFDTVAILEQEKARRKRVAAARPVLNTGMHASETNDPKYLINLVNKYID